MCRRSWNRIRGTSARSMSFAYLWELVGMNRGAVDRGEHEVTIGISRPDGQPEFFCLIAWRRSRSTVDAQYGVEPER